MKATFEIGVTAMHDNAIIAVGIFSSQVEFEINNPEKLENSLMSYIQNIKMTYLQNKKMQTVRLGTLMLNFGGPRYTITIKRIR